MKTEEKNTCISQGKRYAHGAEFCSAAACQRCNDGRWEERFDDLVFGVGP